MSVAYDTLKIARRLADAGLETKTAEGVSETFAEVLRERDDALATKTDIRADMQTLKSDLQTDTQLIRSDLQAIRADAQAMEHRLIGRMHAMQADQLKWMIGSQIALAGILFAAIKLL